MTKELLLDEYQRKYYDVEIEYQLVATIEKRIYVDEMEQFVDTYYDTDYLEQKNIKYDHIGLDEFNKHNMLFAEMVAPDRVEDEDLHQSIQVTDTFVTGSIEGSERAGEEIWQCVICDEHFTGYGNNAEPVKEGICCDTCNTNHVIPARMSELFAEQQREMTKGH